MSGKPIECYVHSWFFSDLIEWFMKLGLKIINDLYLTESQSFRTAFNPILVAVTVRKLCVSLAVTNYALNTIA